MAKCLSCNEGELEELVPGINQCTVCKKIFKVEEDKPEEKSDEGQSDLKDGAFWMKNTSLNKQWEIAEKGITIYRDVGEKWIAAILCHSAQVKTMKYVRLSWFKKSINKHSGMFKINDLDELNNVIIALERIDKNFDDMWKPIGTISSSPISSRKDMEMEDIFSMKTKMCPNCKKTRMTNVGHRRYYDCVACGEIIVLEDQQPIFNIPNEMLPLEFTSNLPVNYYLPYRGITTKHHIADWKAICIIYDKKNPEKRWLRFYWWQRYLQDYISSSVSLGRDEGLKWQAKKGVMSPNVYRKELLPKFIETLKTLKAEWMEEKGMEYTEVEEYDE